MHNPFTKHPHKVGETYFQHMKKALSYGLRIQLLSLMIVVHATFPFLCETTASDGIKELNDCMQNRRKK